MARACSICNLVQRSQLEHMLEQGASNRYLARVFDVTEQAIRRHQATHSYQIKRQELARAKARLKGRARLRAKSCTSPEVEYGLYQATAGPKGGFRKIES